MPQPTNFFKTLTGVPVHYDREPLAPYGSEGVDYKFYATENIEALLDRAFTELWEKCPLGRGRKILSAGAYVDKPGFHGNGEAFDLDGIHWEDKSFITLNYPDDEKFYLGIEATLRKHFPTVLNYNYNVAHRDHLHVDLGGTLEFRTSSESKVFFLQAALKHVLNIPCGIDGDWGTETSGALADALGHLGITGAITQREVWFAFLDRVIQLAFGGAPVTEEKTPTELLSDVYKAVSEELAEGSTSRTRIESALKAFAEHPRIDELLEDVSAGTEAKKVVVSSEVVSGKVKWSAVVDDEPAFYVGTEFRFNDQNTKGIYNYNGIKYSPADFQSDYGFWADFIYPTAVVESQGGKFNCLNTYDKAYFTFGFMQFAAHVYDGDFARYFRTMLALPEAAQYFPDLIVKDGFIHQRNGSGDVKLEASNSGTANPSPLMKYLNPTSTTVEKAEVEQSARFIHWTNVSSEARRVQVDLGIGTFKDILRTHADTYALDGRIDKVCLVIADIHHHGRGGADKVQKIKAALNTNGDVNAAYENLLGVGVTAQYIQERVDTLRATIKTMVQQGKLAKMKYSKAQNDFVPL